MNVGKLTEERCVVCVGVKKDGNYKWQEGDDDVWCVWEWRKMEIINNNKLITEVGHEVEEEYVSKCSLSSSGRWGTHGKFVSSYSLFQFVFVFGKSLNEWRCDKCIILKLWCGKIQFTRHASLSWRLDTPVDIPSLFQVLLLLSVCQQFLFPSFFIALRPNTSLH